MAEIDRRPGVRPRPTLGRRLDIAARSLFPAGVTALLMLLTHAPLGVGGQAALMPATALCGVWFWSLTRPRALPPPVVFLIGVLLDLLGFLPLGIGVLTLLCVHGAALLLRDALAQCGLVWVWLVFAPIATGASVLIWLLVMLLTFRLMSIGPAIFQTGLTLAIYPVLAIPLTAAHRSIASAERA